MTQSDRPELPKCHLRVCSAIAKHLGHNLTSSRPYLVSLWPLPCGWLAKMIILLLGTYQNMTMGTSHTLSLPC